MDLFLSLTITRGGIDIECNIESMNHHSLIFQSLVIQDIMLNGLRMDLPIMHYPCAATSMT